MSTVHLGESMGGEGGTVAVRGWAGVVLAGGPVEGHHGLGSEEEGPISPVEGIRPTGPVLGVCRRESVTIAQGIFCSEYE